MAFVDVPGGGAWLPEIQPNVSSGTVLNSFLLDASGEKVAFIFQVPKTGTLDKFELLLRTVTQAPANGLKFSFQDLNTTTTGNPDGTIDQYRVVTSGITSNAWLAPGLMTSDGTDTGTKRSVTRGDWLCCVVEFESFAASDSLNIGAWGHAASGLASRYQVQHFTTSWSKSGTTHPILALKYDDGTYAHIGWWVQPVLTVASTQFNSGSTPDERGMIVRFPFPAKVSGYWIWADRLVNGRSYDVVLYDSDGSTALATDSTSGYEQNGAQVGKFSSELTLSADTDYRLVMKPTSGNNVAIYEATVQDAAHFAAWPGGQNWHATERTDAGSWSQTTTRRPYMGLLVTAVDDGAGGAGGGLLTHSGMNGGMRG